MSPTSRADGAMAEINVTPMADIMIVLLIIFMVITPLLDEAGVKLPVAVNAVDKETSPDVIVVSIRSDTTTMVGDEGVDNLGELAMKLQERLDAMPEGARAVYLRADEALPYSAILKVLQVCREAGAHEVALLSQRKVEG